MKDDDFWGFSIYSGAVGRNEALAQFVPGINWEWGGAKLALILLPENEIGELKHIDRWLFFTHCSELSERGNRLNFDVHTCFDFQLYFNAKIIFYWYFFICKWWFFISVNGECIRLYGLEVWVLCEFIDVVVVRVGSPSGFVLLAAFFALSSRSVDIGYTILQRSSIQEYCLFQDRLHTQTSGKFLYCIGIKRFAI